MLRSPTRLRHARPSTSLPWAFHPSTVDPPARLAVGGSAANVEGRVRREPGGPRGGRPSDGLPFLGRVGGFCSGARGSVGPPARCVFPHPSWGKSHPVSRAECPPLGPQLIALPAYTPAHPSFDPAVLPVFFFHHPVLVTSFHPRAGSPAPGGFLCVSSIYRSPIYLRQTDQHPAPLPVHPNTLPLHPEPRSHAHPPYPTCNARIEEPTAHSTV